MEDLEEDDGRDGGALVHGAVDVPQRRGQVEAVLATSYTDFPSELVRRKKGLVISNIANHQQADLKMKLRVKNVE